MTARPFKTAIVIGAVILVSVGTAIFLTHHFKQRRATIPKQFQTPRDALSMEAVQYLHQLNVQGRLPGFQKDQKGWALLMPGKDTNHYPIILTVSMRSKNVAGPFPYHYTVIKHSATNSWELQKAWLTDTNGNIVEDFPIP